MKNFIVTRLTTRTQHRAKSLEHLKARLVQHAIDHPKAAPVSDIREGSLRSEWAAKDWSDPTEEKIADDAKR
jgi:hypothetical protein